MIIVQLNGGLGNQLFQYAAARRLAEKNHTELKFDLTRLHSVDARPHEIYGLSHFYIQAEIAEKSEIEEFYAKNIYARIKRKVKQLTGTGAIERVFEKKWYIFDPAIMELSDNSFLWGYWQSEKYFKDIENIIQTELSLKDALTERSAYFENQIKNSKNSVSLHIRRGDYVTDVKTNSFLGLCSLEYYKKCISILGNELGLRGNINIFVFSDDPNWAKENLQSYNALHFLDSTIAEYAYEDIYLMSLCEHNIIANSSFSWWGAWLNRNKYKKVFAPKNWIRGEDSEKLDIIPDNWNRVDNR